MNSKIEFGKFKKADEDEYGEHYIAINVKKCQNQVNQNKQTNKKCFIHNNGFELFLSIREHVWETDQCQLSLNDMCSSLQVHLNVTEELKWRKEGNGTTELKSDLFIVSLEKEIG